MQVQGKIKITPISKSADRTMRDIVWSDFFQFREKNPRSMWEQFKIERRNVPA